MTSLFWSFAFLLLLGTMGCSQAQTCSRDYLVNAIQCMLSYNEATACVSNVDASTGFNTSMTKPFMVVKTLCDSPKYRQAFLCVVNGIKVCGNIFAVPLATRLMLATYDESLINQMCGYLPALEQNLSCLNNLANSSTLSACVTPAYYGSQGGIDVSCRFILALSACALNEVATMCPDVSDAYRGSTLLYPTPYCRMDVCTAQYGECGGKFQRNMPQEAVQSKAGDFVAYNYGIQYICGSGKANVECMMKGSVCEGFLSVTTFTQMFGIELKPASYLVNYGCKDIDTLISNSSCLNEQFASDAFEACINQKLSTLTSIPVTQYDVVSCDIYKATSNCINSIIVKFCGQEIVDYFIKWSPAVFPLAEGCGSWKGSSASSMEKITTLMLIQLSIALYFLLKN
ncbi:hypothetical protein CHS0354_004550 [Potamilus streckersoni]|uniref:Uncharacterized protein n=1 Tax=Potamilus streckersoni TaxID=2493646 RepID=A0AAE0VQM7_9BIVA|nr:hypothetical protein CHS0354_004550 [Potamilus streckersoni]